MNEAVTLISLIKAVLNGETLSLPEGCDAGVIYKMADAHDIAGLVCRGMAEPTEEFKKAQSREMRKYFVQSAELEVLCGELEKAEIFHMPLKGSVIRDIYPSPDMRTSSDIDILVDKSKIENVKDMMLSQGYDMIGIDEYEKKPLLCVEIHLDIDPVQEGLPECLKTGYDGYVKVNGTQYRYDMTDEDQALYQIWHFAKHVLNGGAGIRNIIDIYLFDKKRSPDKEKLERMLAENGLLEFYKRVMKLCLFWFEDGQGDENTRLFAGFVASSGTFGNKENTVAISMAEGQSKAGRLIRKVFPTYREMKNHYKVLHKAPVLLPIFYVVRPIQKLLDPAALKREAGAVANTSGEDAVRMKKMLDDLGLK